VVNLHEVTAGQDLAMFAMFSGGAGTLGGPGQSNYAAANAFLDSFAQYRRALGLPAQSLVWGFWAQATGMSDHLDQADLKRMSRGGVIPLQTAHALTLFDTAIARPDAVLAPLPLDIAVLRKAPALPPLLRDLVATVQRRVQRGQAAVSTAATGQDLQARLAGLPTEQQYQVLLATVCEHVATVLGHAGGEVIDPDRAFKDLGFDSLTAVELRNRLSGVTGGRLPATLVFDHPTPNALTQYLHSQLDLSAEVPVAPLHAELDKLEFTLSGSTVDEYERDRVARRLSQMLANWTGTAGQGDVADKLDAATDDEIFQFVENELGIS
jgi:polyene macrolide polyketide synthase